MAGDWVRFIFVLGCFLLSLTYKKYAASKNDAYSLRLALLLTVGGDFFLILKNEAVIGVLLFCAVQLAYLYRYRGLKATVLASLALPVIFAAAPSRFSGLERAALMYAFCLSASATAAFFSKLPRPNGTAVKLAMISFLLCDLHVVVYNLEYFLDYQRQAFFLIWFFYFPSQFILALSAKSFYLPKKESPSGV